MLTCLKTGLYFHTDTHTVYHCDLYGDLENKLIVLKGFAKEPTQYTGGYHVQWDRVNQQLIPSGKFEIFMSVWNPDFAWWSTWDWMIDDLYCRFETFIRKPKD